MEIREMLKRVDHTKLQAYCTWEEIQVLCEEAMEYETASVCIPPAYVERVHETYGEKINICTVIGFPLGYQATAAKVTLFAPALISTRAHSEAVAPVVITSSTNRQTEPSV